MVVVAIALVAPPLDRTPAQGAATIRGRVTIGIPVPTRRPSSVYSRSAQRVALAPRSEVGNVVIYLEGMPRRPAPPSSREIRQVNEMFLPRTVAVAVGSEVTFPNGDPFFHNVFSLSKPRTFDLGRYPSGETRSVRFDRPGLVRIFCQIHSHMSASVMVFDHPWFTTPDEDGAFLLPDVPPGLTRLVAWHERLGATTATVDVIPGRVVTANFVLPVPRR